MFNELIELVHINVHQKLRGEVTKWKSDSRISRIETLDDRRDKPYDISVRNILFHYTEQNSLIDIRKEFLDVTFQHPDGLGIILGDNIVELAEPPKGSMHTLANLTRIGVGNKGLNEKG